MVEIKAMEVRKSGAADLGRNAQARAELFERDVRVVVGSIEPKAKKGKYGAR